MTPGWLSTCAALLLVSCAETGTPTDTVDAGSAYWQLPLPAGFPEPPVPADNPATPAKFTLGRHLFYDTRLSVNSTVSCASCHEQQKAFSDGKARASGATGEQTPRSSMAIINVAYAASLTWANPLQRTLERQLLIPIFGEHPVEMGMAGREATILALIRQDKTYTALFSAAFPEDADPFTLDRLAQALATFERGLLSGNSPWDRFQQGADASALSPAAKRGADHFFSEEFECYHCHGGFLFSDHGGAQGANDGTPFHNTGLYNLGVDGAYPEGGEGVFGITAVPSDRGRFKAPTLRNITRTAPYMHDGSIATLSEVLDHYAAGGRNVTTGPSAGDGRNNPHKDSLVRGFELSVAEREDLLAFLDALTDQDFLTNPAFANPWPAAGP